MQILLTNQINMAGEVDERVRSSTRIYEDVTGINLDVSTVVLLVFLSRTSPFILLTSTSMISHGTWK